MDTGIIPAVERVHTGQGRVKLTGLAPPPITMDRTCFMCTPRCHPFDNEKSYSKFAAYAFLNHGGDFQTAAKELQRQGYGAGIGIQELLRRFPPTGSRSPTTQNRGLTS
jgi:hypothetical protein